MRKLPALCIVTALMAALVAAQQAAAQVHYHPDGAPWNQRAQAGPDAEVPGWFYNLGITGLRVKLMEEEPTHLLVMYVLPDTPADGKLRIGDVILGAGGEEFVTPHQNGYGMDKFGPQGPLLDFAIALEACQGDGRKARAKTLPDAESPAATPPEDDDSDHSDDWVQPPTLEPNSQVQRAEAPAWWSVQQAAAASIPSSAPRNHGAIDAGLAEPVPAPLPTEPAPGSLALSVRRDGKIKQITLRLGRKYGSFAPTFPYDCKKTELIREELFAYLADQQHDDGSWGGEVENTFAPLALLASGNKRYLPNVEKNVRFHARTTSAQDSGGLINWRYLSAAIVMSEYALAISDKQQIKWLRGELQEVYDFLLSSQYMDLSQVSPHVQETHPDALPHTPLDAHGGWGHNPGFEGYGPIAMITAQGAIAFALMQRVGIEIDPERHQAAYAFLERGTGKNGYTWYEDQVAGDENYADMGRTGASALAHFLAPFPAQQAYAAPQAAIIARHPEPFPDTHGSPLMGMAYTALGANTGGPGPLRALLQANEWWFTLAQCPDGTFYYQPNRDNAGYGIEARLKASAVVAFVLSIPEASLQITGKGAVR